MPVGIRHEDSSKGRYPTSEALPSLGTVQPSGGLRNDLGLAFEAGTAVDRRGVPGRCERKNHQQRGGSQRHRVVLHELLGSWWASLYRARGSGHHFDSAACGGIDTFNLHAAPVRRVSGQPHAAKTLKTRRLVRPPGRKTHYLRADRSPCGNPTR
eukprot:756050-Prorocentrum_minimum.AAC.3